MRRRERIIAALLAATLGMTATAAIADDIVHVTMLGQHFAIPKQYFLDGIHPPEGSEADGLLLGANWPAMTGNSDEDLQGLLILIQPITGGDSGTAILSRRFKFLTRMGQTAFETKPGAEPQPHGNDISPVPSHLVYDMYPWKQVYVVNLESPTDIVACGSIKDVPVPSCIQNFASGRFYFEVTYPRKLVSDWHEIRQETDRLFTQFEVH